MLTILIINIIIDIYAYNSKKRNIKNIYIAKYNIIITIYKNNSDNNITYITWLIFKAELNSKIIWNPRWIRKINEKGPKLD